MDWLGGLIPIIIPFFILVCLIGFTVETVKK